MNRILVLLFTLLLKIRYTRPFTQVLVEHYGLSTLRDFRRLQKLQLQRDKSRCDWEFLEKCKSCGVIPKFLYFKTSVKNFTNSKLYLSILHKSLNFEINNKHRKFIKLSKEFESKLQLFKNTVSWLDFKVVLSKLTKDNANKIKNVKFIHSKKLKSLGIPQDGILEANKVIFNFSDRILSKEEEILKLGLHFGYSSNKVKFVDHYLYFENFAQQLSKLKKNNEQFEELTSKIKTLAQEGLKLKTNNEGKLNLNVLESLRKDKNIIVLRPDKGRGIVILNRADYIKKTKEILDDGTKFN